MCVLVVRSPPWLFCTRAQKSPFQNFFPFTPRRTWNLDRCVLRILLKPSLRLIHDPHPTSVEGATAMIDDVCGICHCEKVCPNICTLCGRHIIVNQPHVNCADTIGNSNVFYNSGSYTGQVLP